MDGAQFLGMADGTVFGVFKRKIHVRSVGVRFWAENSRRRIPRRERRKALGLLSWIALQPVDTCRETPYSLVDAVVRARQKKARWRYVRFRAKQPNHAGSSSVGPIRFTGE
jgi:hypothetical protein